MTKLTGARAMLGAMARRRFTEAQIESALRASGGIQSAAAQALEKATGVRVTRQSIHERIKDSRRLQQVIEEAREEVLDLAESVVIKSLNNADKNPHVALNAARFYLETRGRFRGYVRKNYLVQNIDPRLLSDEELVHAVNELRAMDARKPTTIDVEPVHEQPALSAPRFRRIRRLRG